MTSVPTIHLNDGTSIPQLGFGTYQIEPADTTRATLDALEVGYRHIDTAEMYGNEKEVGDAIRSSSLQRDEVFVTSKLNNCFQSRDEILEAFDRSMKDLDIGHLDLFLIHWPLPTVRDYVAAWKVMQELHDTGQVRSIGVSNFQQAHLEKLFAETGTVPSVNQIEVHPYLVQAELRAFGTEHGIATEAWSPIAQGKVLDDAVATSSFRSRSPRAVSRRISPCSTSNLATWMLPPSRLSTVVSASAPTPTRSTTCPARALAAARRPIQARPHRAE